MKKYFLLIITSLFFLGCSDNENSNKNPYLPNYSFSVDLNLNLPAYSTLKYVSNSIYYPGVGVSGIIVFNTNGSGGYVAFDAACPNQEAGSCAAMTIKGVNALCSCDKKEYNLFTGQATTAATYPMKQYRVQVVSENLIRIYN
jgi:nitrite reductase/ring-hydroxylating ferredoxin subunit